MWEYKDISRIVFVSDDALGCVAKGLVLKMKDGENLDVDGHHNIMEFARRVRQNDPVLADRIEMEVAAVDRPKNYEVLLFEGGV